jgi:predicted PurR-regulated permease PerM
MTPRAFDRSGQVVRVSAVIVAVGVAIALTRYFNAILSPLVAATFLLLLIDGLSDAARRLAPRAPGWVRSGLAGAIILAAFALLGVAMALQAPAFAIRIQSLGPRLNEILIQYGALVGLRARSIDQLLSGINVWSIIRGMFDAARGVVSYSVLVVIYLGFLVASRATVGHKLASLYDDTQENSARRVFASVRNAVQQYMKLQTVKAAITALVAFLVLSLIGVNDAVFVAFAVFLAVYVPIVGPAFGVALPTLLALAQFDDLGRAAIAFGVMEVTVFVNGNVVMPKLQSDSLNVDPLLVLMSLGFWGLILGAPGVVLSTPLTVAAMALAAEFPGTRWLAVLLSKDGTPVPPQRPGKAPHGH